MNLGVLKVATFSPNLKVSDVAFNVKSIIEAIEMAEKENVQILAFPELCISGSTVADLFYSKTLLWACEKGLISIAENTKNKNLLVFVGLPIYFNNNIYNVCACVQNGKILGLVPKTCYLNDKFCALGEKVHTIFINGHEVPFGKDILFCDRNNKSLVVGVEIGKDLIAPISPSTFHAENGARIIINLSADEEFSGSILNRRNLIIEHSKKLRVAYIYANAGSDESTTDLVYSGNSFIVEDGEVLAEKQPFEKGFNFANIDLDYLDFRKSKAFCQKSNELEKDYFRVEFDVKKENHASRVYNKTPFIKSGEEELLLNIQAHGLAKRIKHTNAPKVVIGLSGGLDSTLALLVCERAMKLLNRDTLDVLAITMPCFGTTSRTLENSITLAKALKVSLKKIDISKSVSRHLKDLKHDGSPDVAFENAQARERTQVLMDVANMNGGLVVGTGDLSELALGWATYNGDHMSMYAVNCSIPKTLVRHLVNFCANKSKGKLKAVLFDILDTPVSPELLPQTDDKIKQVTEDIVGPYILHDFFLYHFIKRGATPKSIYYSAVNTFKGEYDEQTILKWLKTFFRRFFTQQFKRSCVPDGVKVSEISLSPRGEWNMPSDAVSKLWLDELDSLGVEK